VGGSGGVHRRPLLRPRLAFALLAFEPRERLSDFGGFELQPMPSLHPRRQLEGTEAGTHQAAHRHPQRGEHAAHEAIAAFAHAHAIPAVRAFPALGFDRVEARRTIFELDTRAQTAHLLCAQLTDQTHRVIAARPIARVRQPVGELAGVGEDQ